MGIRIQRRGLVPAVVVAVVGTVALYVASTSGLAAWHESRSDPQSGVGYLPSILENVPPTVPTTDVYGPPGSVSVVYAGTQVEDGLTGSLDHPWIAVSAKTGEYRALDAPELPEAGAGGVRVSPDGSRLAWTGSEGLVLYDTVTGEVTRPGIDGVDRVGAFSADGAMLAVHADGLQVLDLGTGDVVAQAEATAQAVATSAWRPDGTALDHVTEGDLVTVAVPGGDATTQQTEIPDDAQLAWSPEGDRLVELHEVDNSFRLFLSELRRDGTVEPGVQVDTSGLSLQHLFGFSGARTVAVDAYVLESGSVERVLDVPLDAGSQSDLMTLPAPGDNWVGTTTVDVATDSLAKGSYTWESPAWPWSYVARLGASALFMFFLFGLYVTRRRRG